MNSLTEENYLKALFHLCGEGGFASVQDLSKELGIKMPTVTSMMKKLHVKGLVHYESYRPLSLTDTGRKAAALIIRKHRLAEMFLVEQMGFGWEEVHDVAEQLEHVRAPKFFARMDEMLGFPKQDPHGSPIPNAEGNMIHPAYEKLSACPVQSRWKLAAVLHTGESFLTYLNKHQLFLGTVLFIREKENFDGSMTIEYANNTLTLSAAVVGQLLVCSPLD